MAAAVAAGNLDAPLARLYPGESRRSRRGRVLRLLGRHRDLFGPGEVRLVSAPGRAELGGNHTDHNGGRVLAAAVDLDLLAAARAAGDGTAEIVSRGFPRIIRVDLSRLEAVPGEEGSSEALVRGIAAGFARRGLGRGGFRAVVDGRVLPGSGLSSSAAFETLISGIQNLLHNGGLVPGDTAAEIGWEAENIFFGKPCGRMDQYACGLGGIRLMDFRDPERPGLELIDFDFAAAGLVLFVVHTGEGHGELTADYATVPAEMAALARALGGRRLADLGDLSTEELLRRAAPLRDTLGDRAILRAAHFFAENRRVLRMASALRDGCPGEFLRLVRLSGDSSGRLLQNGYSPSRPERQGIPLALLAAEEILSGEGACRVHGGGFAGTIQAYVPREKARRFRSFMEEIFRPGSVRELRVRKEGLVEIHPRAGGPPEPRQGAGTP